MAEGNAAAEAEGGIPWGSISRMVLMYMVVTNFVSKPAAPPPPPSAADALQQMFQRFFLVPGSGFAQASTMTRVVVTYLETQTLALMSTATLRNGPYGSVGEWAGKDLLPKSYWG